MKNTLKISLKPNEKIYLNGAVVRVDRKVTLELLNDVHFLLESHVLQIDEASTPLRQLYFILQVMLMNPTGANDAYEMFRRSLPLMIASFSDPEISGHTEADRPHGRRRPCLRSAEGDPRPLSARTPRARRKRRRASPKSGRPAHRPRTPESVFTRHDALVEQPTAPLARPDRRAAL